MKIYNLVFVDTQEGFTPKSVTPFVSEELAHKEMMKQIVKESGIPIEQLEEGYDEDGWCVGYDYARNYDTNRYWEIYECELVEREAIIGSFIAYIHENYALPKRYDDTLYRLINEYSDADLKNGTISKHDFLNDRVIGEALYQNVFVSLGGRADDYDSHYAISDYLDCSGFEEKEIHDFWDMSNEEKEILKKDSHQRWFLLMVMLCSGEEDTLVRVVRSEIDRKQPNGKKIFIQERLNDIKEIMCNLDIPKNHRELCSKLTDEQYLAVMELVLNHNFDFSGNPTNLCVTLKNFYESVRYHFYKLIRAKGTDFVLEKYAPLIELEDLGNGNYDIVFHDDPLETAIAVEQIKKDYKDIL